MEVGWFDKQKVGKKRGISRRGRGGTGWDGTGRRWGAINTYHYDTEGKDRQDHLQKKIVQEEAE